MSVRVYIPTPFRKITGNRTFVEADGSDVNGVLRDLEQRFPGFGEMVFDGEQELLEHVNVYLNSQEIRVLQGANTRVSDGDEVAVIPALAGGAAMTPEMVERYSRHLIMDQVGPVGQRKLIDGKVLAVGAGGLGSPVLVYLAAAGVGTIGIVDFDVVDRSNLQRQIIHGTSDIGRPKVESAQDRIADLNPNIAVQTHTQPLTSENAMEIISAVRRDHQRRRQLRHPLPRQRRRLPLRKNPRRRQHLPVRGAGNDVLPPARAATAASIPARRRPAWSPPAAEAGVLGVLPGTIGAIPGHRGHQGPARTGRAAQEPPPPLRRPRHGTSAPSKSAATPACPLCGDAPSVTELIDYEEFCGSPFHEGPAAANAVAAGS